MGGAVSDELGSQGCFQGALSCPVQERRHSVIVEVAWRAEHEGDGLLSCFLFIIVLKRGPEVNAFTLSDATSSRFTIIPCPIKMQLLS